MERNDWIEATTVADLLLRTCELNPSADAIVFPDERATYQELAQNSQQIACRLNALGIENGDHVGIMMPNCMDFINLIFGIAILGAVVVPINARYKSSDLPYVVKNADLKCLFTTDRFKDYVDFKKLINESFPEITGSNSPEKLELPSAPLLKNIIVMSGDSQSGFLGEDQFNALTGDENGPESETINLLRERVKIRDVSIMMYTSGTTSNPKGCPLTHEALIRTSMAMGRDIFSFSSEDAVWSPLPLFHLASVLPLLASIDGGGEIYFHDSL